MSTPRALPQAVSVTEHRSRIMAAMRSLPPVSMPLAAALGRTLARDVIARVDVPGFRNSAMDGYAVRQADVMAASEATPVRLRVVADLPAGSSLDPRIGHQEAALIMTGAPVPGDADCVVPLEHTDSGTVTVAIHQAPQDRTHVRQPRVDASVGEVVLAAGQVLGSRDLAAGVAIGARDVWVRPAPRIGVLSTGSELRPAGEPLERGQIYDSNSVLLAAAVAECGAEPVQLGAVPDDEDALREIFEAHAGLVDAFVTSGGVSVGDHDVVRAVLAPLGVWFGPVRMQPGKPQGFGHWPSTGTPIFALPGNPVAMFVSFEQFVRPALLTLQGRHRVLRKVLHCVASEGWHSPAGRIQFMPAVVDYSNALSVRPATSGGARSYLVAGLSHADALVAIPESTTEVHAGDLVEVTIIGESTL